LTVLGFILLLRRSSHLQYSAPRVSLGFAATEESSGASFSEAFSLAAAEESLRAKHGASFAAWTADSEYHIALVEACGNARLIEEYRRIALPNLFYRQHYVTRNHPSSTPDGHIRLTEELLSEKSPDKAEKRIRAHISSGILKLSEILGD
jgi:DNA-binding GntR family transcriptional regulator